MPEGKPASLRNLCTATEIVGEIVGMSGATNSQRSDSLGSRYRARHTVPSGWRGTPLGDSGVVPDIGHRLLRQVLTRSIKGHVNPPSGVGVREPHPYTDNSRAVRCEGSIAIRRSAVRAPVLLANAFLEPCQTSSSDDPVLP